MYYSRYPKDWKAISFQIRSERAKWRCEWCGVKNGRLVARDCEGVFHYATEIDQIHVEAREYLFGTYRRPKLIKIVLTVAHLGVPYPDGRLGNKHDKSDCRPENLAALCQRCHLNYDRADHMAKASATRARKTRERDAARGRVQLELL